MSDTTLRHLETLRAIPRHPRKTTASEVHRHLLGAGFDIDKRSVERDLHKLSTFYPISCDDSGRPAGWFWQAGAADLIAPGLTTGEALELEGLRGGVGELVPRAGGQAVVAAIDAVADGGTKLARDRPLVLDGEVGDAAPRIEPVGGREGVGGAGVEAGAAGAAMVGLGRVRLEFGRGEDRAQEQPRAVRAADQVGVPALPAYAGGGRQRLLHHWRGVHEHLHVAARARDDLAGDLLQPALHHLVVVAVAGVDRDGAAIAPGKQRSRVLVRAVIHGQHDDGAHLGPQYCRVGAALQRLGDPAHRAVEAGGDKFGKPRGRLRDGVGPGHGDGVEAGRRGLAVDQRAKPGAVRSRGPHSATPAKGRARGRPAAAGRRGATSPAYTIRARRDIRSS